MRKYAALLLPLTIISCDLLSGDAHGRGDAGRKVGGKVTTDTAGGGGDVFLTTLGVIVIPEDGARVALHGTTGSFGTSWTADATATATK
jgi:hypothetical protein